MSSLTVHFFFDKARFIFHYTKEFTLGRGRAGKLQTFLNSLFSLISSHHSLKKISQFDLYLKRSFFESKDLRSESFRGRAKNSERSDARAACRLGRVNACALTLL